MPRAALLHAVVVSISILFPCGCESFLLPLKSRDGHLISQPSPQRESDSPHVIGLFNLKRIFDRRRKDPSSGIIEEDEKEKGDERRRYDWGKELPSIEDLWKEAWPTQAAGDWMKRRDDTSRGRGPPHFEHTYRNFGVKDDANLTYSTFYRDSAGWCPFCQSVGMMLEEKQMPYRVKKTNLLSYGEKQDWFIGSVSPTGLLPVLEVDDRTIRDSVEICKFINRYAGSRNPVQMHPEKSDPLHEVAEGLLLLERDLFKEWFIWLFEGPTEERGRQHFLAVLHRVEKALGAYAGPWFLGDDHPSLVDCVFAPQLERMIASCIYWKGLRIRHEAKYPNLRRWLRALDQRPSYTAFKSDFFTLIKSLPPMFGKAYAVDSPAVKGIQAMIDGSAPCGWGLPVTYSDKDLEYLPSDLVPTETYTRQAAAVKLIISHKLVPKYMLRALGRRGPSYRSELADPYNQPDQLAQFAAPEIDAAYRYLIIALLRDRNEVEPLIRKDRARTDMTYGEGANRARKRIVKCLLYLRERIGVPRDMTLPEARQLRGTLTWMVDILR